MRFALLVTLAAAVTVSGCATKRYGRMLPLSSAEAANLDCRGINAELSRIDAFDRSVADGSRVDGRSALGFLADFGIGNKMERDDAERSARQRRVELENMRAQKRCTA